MFTLKSRLACIEHCGQRRIGDFLWFASEPNKEIVQLPCSKKRRFTTNPVRNSRAREIRAIVTSPTRKWSRAPLSSSPSKHFFTDTSYLFLCLAFEAGYQKLGKITRLSKHVQKITIPFKEGEQGYFPDAVILYFVNCVLIKKLLRESWLKCIPWGVKCKSPWLWIVNR